MKKLALFSSIVLSLAFTSLSDATLAEHKHNLNAQLLAQSTQEPQSPEDFINSLNLTDEQKNQIQIILNEHRPEIIATFQELKVALQNLTTVVNPNSSNNEIRIARDKVVYLERQLSDLLFEELIGIRGELTVEQREKINQRIRELASSQANK